MLNHPDSFAAHVCVWQEHFQLLTYGHIDLKAFPELVVAVGGDLVFAVWWSEHFVQ